jgi:hypothetical protein
VFMLRPMIRDGSLGGQNVRRSCMVGGKKVDIDMYFTNCLLLAGEHCRQIANTIPQFLGLRISIFILASSV